MSARADYTDDEWVALRRSLSVAAMAVSFADPGGPIELTKESMAGLRAAGSPPSDDPLLVAISRDALAEQQQRKNPLADFEVKGPAARERIADELRRVNAILEQKADPAEAAAFRQWIVAAAQEAANAAKEGGFMGIGAVRVSEGEQAMLEQLRGILDLPAA